MKSSCGVAEECFSARRSFSIVMSAVLSTKRRKVKTGRELIESGVYSIYL